MKILLAGGGAFGEEHLKRLVSRDLSIALAEPRDARRNLLASRYHLAASGPDAEPLLEQFAPDGVIVASPAQAHAPLATLALARNIPVLVEKPVAPDSITMRALLDAQAQSRAFLLPGHVLRFSAAHSRAREILVSGEIGDMLHFTSRRYRDSGHVATYPDVDPVFMTMIHDIDLALWCDGGVAISAMAWRPAGACFTAARLLSDGGALWDLRTGWLHPAGLPEDRVEIIGTKGSIELVTGSHLAIHATESRREETGTEPDPLRAELICFLSGIRNGRLAAPVTAEDALNGLHAAELIMAALAQ